MTVPQKVKVARLRRELKRWEADLREKRVAMLVRQAAAAKAVQEYTRVEMATQAAAERLRAAGVDHGR